MLQPCASILTTHINRIEIPRSKSTFHFEDDFVLADHGLLASHSHRSIREGENVQENINEALIAALVLGGTPLKCRQNHNALKTQSVQGNHEKSQFVHGGLDISQWRVVDYLLSTHFEKLANNVLGVQYLIQGQCIWKMTISNNGCINSLRPSDAYMRQKTEHHWFR